MNDVFYVEPDASPNVLFQMFSDNEVIDGIICGADSKVATIPNNLTVNGSVYLQNCNNLKTMPQAITVTECLSLNECKNLEHLPEQLNVSGDLDLSGTNITCLDSKRIIIGSTLSLNDCPKLTSIPGTDVLTVQRILIDPKTYKRIKAASEKNDEWKQAFNEQKDKIFILRGESYMEIPAAEWEKVKNAPQENLHEEEMKRVAYEYEKEMKSKQSKWKKKWIFFLLGSILTTIGIIVLMHVFEAFVIYLCSVFSPEKILLNGNATLVGTSLKYQLLSTGLLIKDVCAKIFPFILPCYLFCLVIVAIINWRLDDYELSKIKIPYKVLNFVGKYSLHITCITGETWIMLEVIMMCLKVAPIIG